jgi:hypothetical protein
VSRGSTSIEEEKEEWRRRETIAGLLNCAAKWRAVQPEQREKEKARGREKTKKRKKDERKAKYQVTKK